MPVDQIEYYDLKFCLKKSLTKVFDIILYHSYCQHHIIKQTLQCLKKRDLFLRDREGEREKLNSSLSKQVSNSPFFQKFSFNLFYFLIVNSGKQEISSFCTLFIENKYKMAITLWFHTKKMLLNQIQVKILIYVDYYTGNKKAAKSMQYFAKNCENLT